MDTLKTNIQCAECPNNTVKAGPNAAPNCTKVSLSVRPSGGGGTILGTFKAMTTHASYLRLWRGVHTMFIGCVPAHALYFSAYELSKETFNANQVGVHTPLAAGITGAISTVCHDMIMTPMDTIKQRLQLGYYDGLYDCARNMVEKEGVASFYRSFGTTLAMNIPYGMVMVASNESLKKVLSPDGQFSLSTSLLAGSGAGAIASAATCPLDCIKTRLQVQGVALQGGKVRVEQVNTGVSRAMHTNSSGAPGPMCRSGVELPKIRYAGAIDAAKDILRTDGYRGLFRGLAPRMLTQMPAVAISWTTYESVKRALGNNNTN